MNIVKSKMNSLEMNEASIKEEVKIRGMGAEKPLVIMLDNIKTPQKNDIDGEKEEMQRAIVNINRKTRPLIKHVNVVENDILHIDVVDKKTVSKFKKPKSEVSNWEDLLNEEDNVNEDPINQVMFCNIYLIISYFNEIQVHTYLNYFFRLSRTLEKISHKTANRTKLSPVEKIN